MKNQYRVNEQIRARDVRVVSDGGAEVMPARKALELARQQELDLVEISPNAQPPVCRIVDYSKFLYQQKKHAKEMKQKQVKVETKEIRFGPQTDEHDYQFKLKHAMEFLNEGNKVRAYVFFRGRSILFKEQGEVLLLRFANDLEEYGKVEQMPKLEGKKMFLYMSPKKAGTAKKSQQKMDREKREAEAKAAADAERAANAEKNGNVIVRAPLRTGLPRIKRFVNQKQEWVLGCLERTKEYREQKPLSADLSESKRNVYIRKAKETITKRVSYFARLMGVSYRNITIREQKTRWGSCSSEKNLNFNWKLILAPPEVLDYVVVHELCHLKEMNHSKAFWDEVEKVMPEYETYKLWLKENGWRL